MSAQAMGNATDVKRGQQALSYFARRAAQYVPDRTFAALVDEINAKSPYFFDGFGFAVAQAEISETRLEAVMEDLAERGQGRLPVPLNTFFNALSAEAVKVDAWEAVKSVTVDSAADIAQGAAFVGEQVITTGKWALYAAPVIAVAAFAIWAFTESGGLKILAAKGKRR